MIEIGNDGLFRDSVAYYLYGDEYAAKKLKLRANINNSPISNCSKKYHFIACGRINIKSIRG